jgi:hypothetical protein
LIAQLVKHQRHDLVDLIQKVFEADKKELFSRKEAEKEAPNKTESPNTMGQETMTMKAGQVPAKSDSKTSESPKSYRSVPAFTEVGNILSAEQPKEAQAWKQFFSRLMNVSHIRWSEIVAFVGVKANLLPKEAIKTLMNAAHHPKARVRATVLAVLKEITKGQTLAELKKTNELYFKTLAKLARDRENDKIKEEAIKTLLEMGSQGKEDQRDMEALLHEIDFYRTIENLLKSRNIARIKLGLSLLSQAWKWVHAAKREEFAKMALEMARKSPEEVRRGVVELIQAHRSDLPREIVSQLHRKPFDKYVWTANAGYYNGGGSRFVN